MHSLNQMSQTELKELYTEFKKEYDEICKLGINLDISRGKPNAAQLDLSNGLMTCLDESIIEKCSFDYRNYGVMEGVPSARKMFAPLLGVDYENTLVCGNSSLNIMYDCIVRAMLLGVLEGKTPWSKLEKVKFLCPSPGYDRHFAICEEFGIEMIVVDMTESGPDMDRVEELVAADPTIKGMWCVPKYSNPQGITYSDETVRRLAKMKTAADDFRIFWDNAYCMHDLYDDGDELLSILDACTEAGNPDRPYIFFSTSKISFAGSGVAAMGGSKANIDWQKKRMTIQTISFDKINQLRHVIYYKDADGLKEHMKKHAEILRPKFETVLSYFDRELAPLGCVYYPRPRGGYFISLDVPDGCAKRVVELCKNAGISLTPAGSTYPYKKDPRDRNIRIAPSYLDVKDLEKACKALCASVKLACAEKFYKIREMF
ncbi:MAG: aminotransferase class I/II-fold pyridoxal phosphate-dependent enzyme [Ruminococcaceae bacterium]|nr:aminotransferase class I/II-fold pyridoxal phosphate-dependent enzyme [Oscillospiraceae bacterium]